ncbi:hypothetical protein [Streptomyces sp. N35]|uniref:hypothetical protein n=1 Tax=Streptomyces sp. N35 TaxID=2795730 RepID=UPI0018F473DC|nr:hypothetical protein [Streptomyces sp. N35]
MSKYLPDISPELESAFVAFRAECTKPVSMAYTTPVYAIRATFRAWLRENGLPLGKPTETQLNWLLDDANIPLETLTSRLGPKLLYACGIRLTTGGAK